MKAMQLIVNAVTIDVILTHFPLFAGVFFVNIFIIAPFVFNMGFDLANDGKTYSFHKYDLKFHLLLLNLSCHVSFTFETIHIHMKNQTGVIL